MNCDQQAWWPNTQKVPGPTTSGGFVEVKNCLNWYSASHQHFGSTFVSPSLPNWRTVQWPGSLMTSTIFHYPFARSTPALGHSLMRYIPRKLFVPIRWHCHAKLGMTSHATVQTCTDQLGWCIFTVLCFEVLRFIMKVKVWNNSPWSFIKIWRFQEGGIKIIFCSKNCDYIYTANTSIVKITLFNCVRVSTVISLWFLHWNTTYSKKM